MKTTLTLLFITISFFVNSQNFAKSDLSLNDLQFNNGTFISRDDLKIGIVNADYKFIDCRFFIFFTDKEKFKSATDLNIPTIKKMVNDASLNTLTSIVNKYTYVPKKVDLKYYGNAWSVEIEFIAQNNYGATKNDINSTYYDFSGKKISVEEFLDIVKEYEKTHK